MKKTKKSMLILALVAGFVSASTAGVFGISGIHTAKAEVTTADIAGNFEVLPGAYVRLHKPKTGIRFASEITEEYYNAVKAANPNANIVLATEISVSKPNTTPEILWCSTTPEFEDDGVFTYYASMTFEDLTEEQMAKAVELEMTATAQIYNYVDEDNYTLLYESEAGDMRSMKAVANMAKLNGIDDKENLLDVYVNDASVNTKTFVAEAVNENTVLTVNAPAGTYEAYVGAEKTELTVAEDQSVTIANTAFANTQLGATTYVSLFDSNNNVYATPVQYVTQAISDAAELSAVLVPGTAATTVDGYYVLDDDITVTMTESHAGLTFNGTFDGNGHMITLPDPLYHGCGLFGTLTGTVKNLALTYNLTKDYGHATYDNKNALLARGGIDGVVENLYVKLNGSTGLLKTSFSVFGSCYYGMHYSSINNVVIDCGDVISETLTDNLYGLIFHEGTPGYVTNAYVISSGLKYTSYKSIASFAENDEELKAAYDVDKEEGSKARTQNGVKRYDTWAKLIEKEQNNAFSSFNNKYWDTTNGAPLWHSIAEDFFAMEWTGDNLVWSTNEEQITLPQAMGAVADVVEVYNKTDSVLVYDGKTWVKETLANTTNELASKDIRIKFKNGTTYLATLDCVTQAISDATELESVLPASGTVTGYYILDNDIPVSAWTIANHNGFNFNGVLDGQGYTISAPQILYGLFGNFGGTIKNVDIQITKVLTSGVYTYTGPNAGIISNHIVGTANVENVNVKLCGTTNEIKVTFSTFGYLNYNTTKLNLKNVVIDCGDVVSETLTGTTYSGLLVHWGNCASKVAATNVYFISSTHKYLSADNSTNNTNCYVAANDTTLQHPTLTTNTLAGVYRYDSWDGVATDVLNALDSDYWTVENGALVWQTK